MLNNGIIKEVEKFALKARFYKIRMYYYEYNRRFRK